MSFPRGPTDDAMYNAPPLSPMGPLNPQYRTQWPGPQEMAASNDQRPLPRGPEPPAGTQRYRALMIGFFLVFLFYLIYLQTRADIGDNGTLRGLSDLFVLFGSTVCTITCWYTALTLRKMQATTGLLASRAWIAWTLLGGAAFTYSVGQAIWTWYDGHYTSAQLPFPAVYDPFYLLVYPLSWVGIALLIPRGGTAAGRTRLLLDAGIAVASALAITWYFILGPTVTSLMGPPIEKVVALAYPLGDLSLLVASALLLFGPSGASALNGALSRLAIGVTWLALTDSLYGYFQLQGAYHTGLIQDIGWPMSWLFIGWAALVYPAGVARLTGQRLPGDQLQRNTRLSTTGAALRAITPIVLALFTCAVLLLVVGLGNTAPFTQVVFVCAGLILLPVIRQLLTLVDNLLLNERLRVALGQSQQAYQQSQQALVATSSRAERYDELREGIENLQAVHAQLARGNLGIRAQVRGPLTPVAQSLNLLIDRLNRWSQFAQINQMMEGEAHQLRYVLDELSEGRASRVPPSRSPLATGGALISAGRLQRQLGLVFGRLRGTISQVTRAWTGALQVVHSTRQTVQQQGNVSPQQQAQLLRDALNEVERYLVVNQALLQDLWRDTNLFVGGEDGNSMPDFPVAKPPPSEDSLPEWLRRR